MACGVFLKRQAGSSDGTSLPMFCFFHALRRRQCSWGQSKEHIREWHRSAYLRASSRILRVPLSRKLYSSLISGDKICHFIRFPEIRPEIRRARWP
jgi:hypothetical protein